MRPCQTSGLAAALLSRAKISGGTSMLYRKRFFGKDPQSVQETGNNFFEVIAIPRPCQPHLTQVILGRTQS
jgi:hypothetical protein